MNINPPPPPASPPPPPSAGVQPPPPSVSLAPKARPKNSDLAAWIIITSVFMIAAPAAWVTYFFFQLLSFTEEEEPALYAVSYVGAVVIAVGWLVWLIGLGTKKVSVLVIATVLAAAGLLSFLAVLNWPELASVLE